LERQALEQKERAAIEEKKEAPQLPRISGVCKTTGEPCKNCSKGRVCRWSKQGRPGHI